jgi:predicted DNA binding CopG/RHH family protein
MKIKDIIIMFQKYHDQEEELAITWWSITDFEDDKEFQIALENIDHIDWSDVHEHLTEEN